MRIIVGLGNPGSEYETTRHNVGFEVIDSLASKLNVHWRGERSGYNAAEGALGGRRFLLVKPLTYMNNSGMAVAEVANLHRVPPSDLLVIVDDFQLPLGILRMRPGGSDGGHNGLYSIQAALGTSEYPRLRCGIAGATLPARKSDLAMYVLSPFEKEEKEIVKRMITVAAEVAMEILRKGIDGVESRQTIRT